MRWSEIAVYVTIVLALALWWVWVAASRLDRLHRKVGTSRAVLDAQLVRRATVAAELATSGLLDPVSSVLVGEAAWAALSTEASELPADLLALVGPDDVPDGRRGPAGGRPRGHRERAVGDAARGARRSRRGGRPARGPGGRRAGGRCSRRPGTACSWPAGSTTRRSPRRARARRGPLRPRCCVWPGTRPEPRSLELDDALAGEPRPARRRGAARRRASRPPETRPGTPGATDYD